MLLRPVIIIKQQPQTNLYPFPLSVEYDEMEGQLSVIALPFVGSYSLFLNDDTLANVQEFSTLPQSWQFDSTVLWEVNTAILTTHAVDGQTDTDSVYRLVFNFITEIFVMFPLTTLVHTPFTLPYPSAGKGYNPSSWPSGQPTDADWQGIIDYYINATRLTPTHITWPTWYPSTSYQESGDVLIGRIRERLALQIPQYVMPDNPTFSLDDGDPTQGQIWFTLNVGKGVPFAADNGNSVYEAYEAGLYGLHFPIGQTLNSEYFSFSDNKYGNYYYYSFQVRLPAGKVPLNAFVGVFRVNGTLINSYVASNGKYELIQSGQIAVIGCYIAAAVIDTILANESNGIVLNCVGMEFV